MLGTFDIEAASFRGGTPHHEFAGRYGDHLRTIGTFLEFTIVMLFGLRGEQHRGQQEDGDNHCKEEPNKRHRQAQIRGCKMICYIVMVL